MCWKSPEEKPESGANVVVIYAAEYVLMGTYYVDKSGVGRVEDRESYEATWDEVVCWQYAETNTSEVQRFVAEWVKNQRRIYGNYNEMLELREWIYDRNPQRNDVAVACNWHGKSEDEVRFIANLSKEQSDFILSLNPPEIVVDKIKEKYNMMPQRLGAYGRVAESD